MEHLANTIMQRIQKLPEGTPVSAKMLLGFRGTRAAVDQALARLHRRGELIRVGRGLYVLPVQSRFGKHAPAPEKSGRGVCRPARRNHYIFPCDCGERIGFDDAGSCEIDLLYLGRSRKLKFGKLQVELKHAPNWQLGSGIEGDVVGALVWAGPQKAEQTLTALSQRFRLPSLNVLSSTDLSFQAGWQNH